MNTRYVTSLVSFGTKGVCAFVITYLLANSLPVDEFALWATIFSFGMILSVADLGVGQLVLTTLHENDQAVVGDTRLMTNAVAAMAILSTILVLLTFVALMFYDFLDGIRWKHLIISVILLRLIFIPFGAVLSISSRCINAAPGNELPYHVGIIGNGSACCQFGCCQNRAAIDCLGRNQTALHRFFTIFCQQRQRTGNLRRFYRVVGACLERE
jgi:hypothetical protein